MDVKIRSDVVRSQRERRAWSQEHLAGAAGVGLRTIQRIEATGNASYDSVRAIALALGVAVDDLIVTEMQAPRAAACRPWWRRVVPTAIAAAAIGGGAMFVSAAFGSDVMLEVDLSYRDEQAHSQMITTEGEAVEIRVEGVFRVLIVPTVQSDGSVLLSTQLYEKDESGFVLVSAPKLAALNDQAAEVHVTSGNGSIFKMRIIPTIQ